VARNVPLALLVSGAPDVPPSPSPAASPAVSAATSPRGTNTGIGGGGSGGRRSSEDLRQALALPLAHGGSASPTGSSGAEAFVGAGGGRRGTGLQSPPSGAATQQRQRHNSVDLGDTHSHGHSHSYDRNDGVSSVANSSPQNRCGGLPR
jgi:hypothetical protein